MSGGVDSSVTAAVLKEQGFDVVGMTLQLYDHGQATTRANTCCAGRDIRDARRVAEALGIPHYVLDYEDTFERDVIVPFAEAYVRGETPIPCVQCNRTVKFRDLIAAARELDADALATGHYARRVDGPHGPELWRGREHRRDQSYFLFATTREQLAFLRFPLGDLDKDETRAIARRLSLSVADKPDSQDICFVPDGDYVAVVERLRPGSSSPGPMVHVDGREVGHHRGLIHYTVGQRRGLGVGGFPDPLYVVRLEPATNRLIVGPRQALACTEVVLREVNWLGDGEAPPREGRTVSVKLRSLHEPVRARLYGLDGGGARLEMIDPFFGVAPGQAGVFYDDERCLGGGWICAPAP